MIEYFIIGGGAGLLGFTIAYLIYKNMYSADQYVSRELFIDEQNKVAEQNDEKEIEIAKLNSELLTKVEEKNKEKEQAIDEKNKEIVELNSVIAKHTESIENYEIKLKEEKKHIKDLYDQNKDQFENLANDILDKKSEKFVKLNKSNLDQILKPLGVNHSVPSRLLWRENHPFLSV